VEIIHQPMGMFTTSLISGLGSVIWCFNGSFVWLPLVAPSSEFKNEVRWGGGLTGFIGATVFELGSVLLMLEAVNENRTDCFGWALERSISNQHLRLSTAPGHACRHHHFSRRSFLKAPSIASDGKTTDDDGDSTSERLWNWWPTWEELRTHYFREIGFLACFFQFWGATIFWIAGICGLPPISDQLTGRLLDGVYWVPQVSLKIAVTSLADLRF